MRLFSFLALAASVVHFVKRDSAFLEWRATRAVVVCGKHSLYVFCLGILLSVLGHFILTEFYGGIGAEIAVNLAGSPS